MPDQPPSRNAADVLRDLHNYLAEPPLNTDALSEQEVQAELKRRKIAPGASFRAIHELLEDHIAAAELAAAKQTRINRLATVRPTVSVLSGVREKIHKLIQSLSPQVAAAYWSKFESAGEEDLQSLYDDLMELSGQQGDATADDES